MPALSPALLDVDPALSSEISCTRPNFVAADIAEVLAARAIPFPAAESGSGGWAPSRSRRSRPTKVSPDRAARSSKSSSAAEIAQPKILPPHRLLFAAVPIERMGEQPPRLLFRRSRSLTSAGTSAGQARDERVDFLLPGAEFLARLPVRYFRARHVGPVRDQRRATSSSQSRSASVERQSSSIVARDDASVGIADEFKIAELQAGLHLGERRVGVRERGCARIAVKRLELLDRIALDARSEPVADDAVEIDEALRRAGASRSPPLGSRSVP